ncbi:hypothetical protein HDU98_011871 [Podochytrium sp. JEL0797]|nr:hypothetical protein HDU98_011871 [Podochytrium sp. JEL0797]
MPQQHLHTSPDYIQIAQDIRDILPRRGYDNGNIGPILVRLAWHSAGTFSKQDGTGGSNGATMRFAPESTDDANAGLDVARAFLEPIKSKHPSITHSDLWTLAGVISIQELGGPRIFWMPGRVDHVPNPTSTPLQTGCPIMTQIPPNGRLPDASLDASHLRHIFNRMGFTDREIVALSGAHCLGMCHTDRSGYDGVWTHTPNEFTNKFYIDLLERNCEYPIRLLSLPFPWTNQERVSGRKRDWDDWTGPVQYMDDSEELMMLPTDMALLWDPEFKVVVQEYAADQALFFKDFALAFGKLLELGVPRRVSSEPGPVVCEPPSAPPVRQSAWKKMQSKLKGWFRRS